MPKLARSHLSAPLTAAALALALGLSGPAAAQDSATTPATPAAPAQGGGAETATPPADATPPAGTAEAPANPNQLNMGQGPAEGGVGSTYISANHGDWAVRCARAAQGRDPCQLYQLLKDAQGNSVAEVSLFALPAGQQAAAGATIITPLETLLTQQITLQIDNQQPRRYPFAWCAPVGCISRIGFTQPEVDQLKKGNKATITIVPVAAPDQKVVLNVSLKGFTAGFDAVTAINKP